MCSIANSHFTHSLRVADRKSHGYNLSSAARFAASLLPPLKLRFLSFVCFHVGNFFYVDLASLTLAAYSMPSATQQD